jgi:hypothetical protein
MVTKTKRKTKGKSTPSGATPLRWSVERRLAFIEERLFWLGEVNRMDLVQHFGVSMSQASGDIARYLALDPPGVTYDKSAKRYAAGETFSPVLTVPNATQLIGELRLVDLGILSEQDTILGTLPSFDTAPIPERPVDPFVLRAVLRAIRDRVALMVRYQSMSRPEPGRRIIEPHSFAYDGFRWHARAFDRETGQFRDFVLGRLSKPELRGEAQSRPKDDVDWHTFVALVIAPHPGLTPGQARAIAIDYGIHGTSASLRVRRALLFYALRRLGLDVAPDTRPAREQHIVLLNRADVVALSKDGAA